jgi:hypothetical protein
MVEYFEVLNYSHLPYKPNDCIRVLHGKGKAIPIQAWTGPDVSRSLRLSDFKTIDIWRL